MALKFSAPQCPLRCRSISAISTTQSRFLSESFSSTYPPGERKSCSSSSEVKNIPQNSKVCLQVSQTEKCYRRDHMSSETGNVKYVSVNRKNRGKKFTHNVMTSRPSIFLDLLDRLHWQRPVLVRTPTGKNGESTQKTVFLNWRGQEIRSKSPVAFISTAA